MFAKLPLTRPRSVALLLGACLLMAQGGGSLADFFEDRDGDADGVWNGKPMPRPDSPGEAMAFRLRQWRDQNGVYDPAALMEAKAHVDAMRRQPARGLASPVAGISRAGWTWLGPGNIGGRVRSLVIDPTNVNKMFAGSVGGGIFKTTDGGASWAPVNDFMANLAVSTMVIQPGTPTTIYAGTGEGFFNGDGLQGAGVFKSTDGGTTWNQLPATNNPNGYYVNRLAISPDGRTLVAAARSGLYDSTDGGSNWSLRLAPPDFHGFTDVDFHPTNPTRAVASGYSGDAYYSIDGGVTWRAAAGLQSGPFRRVEIAYARSNPSIVYAAADVNSGTIYKSVDGGVTYAAVSIPPQHYLGQQGWYDNALWVDPTNANVLVVGGMNLWKSTDGGATISQMSEWGFAPASAHADHHVIVEQPGFDGSTNKTVFFTNDGGVYKAADVYTVGGGAFPYTNGWTALNNNLGVTQFYGAGGNAAAGVILGGTQDNGTIKYTTATGTTWSTEFGGDGGFSAVSQSNANNLFGEYVYLQLHRSLDGGASSDWINGLSWTGSSYVCKPAPYSIVDSCNNFRANFIAPFVLDPNDSNTLLAGGMSLWRTNDASTPNTPTTGPAWTNIKPAALDFDPISAIGVAPIDSSQIWVGHNGGELFKTTNGLTAAPAWTRMGAGTLPNRYVMRARVDPTNANTIYVAYGGFVTPNLWKSVDGGTTWSAAAGTGVSALPAAPVRDVAVNPFAPSWLYAATEVGIFTSQDGGATWTVPQDGPANVSVDELFWMGSSLVAVTHGRGLFKTEPAGVTPGTLTGHVRNAATSVATSGASVDVYFLSGSFAAHAVTDSSGSYVAGGLSTGSYFAFASSPGFQTQLYDKISCALGCNAFTQATPILVAAGSTTSNIDFALAPGGTFGGRITNAATGASLGPNQSVQIYGASGGFLSSVGTDTAGHYTTPGLPTGTYYARTANSLGFGDKAYDNIPCANCNPVTTAGTAAISVTEGLSAGNTFNFALSAALFQSQGPNFGTFSIGEIELPLSATGGSGANTWSVVGGALPPGLSVRTDTPSWFPVTANAGLIGVATTPGTYTFTLRVASGTATADQLYTLRVTGLQVKDGNQFNYLPDAFVGDPYSYQLTALDAAGTATWTATSLLPAGITLSPSGLLAGTPTTAGFYFVNLRVADGVDTVFQAMVLPVNALNITTPAVLPNATAGVAYSTTLTATGGIGPYTFSSGCCLPFGLTLSSSGTISGTVSTFAPAGPSVVDLTVTDSVNLAYRANMSIDVISIPAKLPSIDLSPYFGRLYDCTIGVTCSRGIAVRSGGTAPFTWTAEGLPPGVSIRSGTGAQQSWVSAGSTWGFNLTAGDAELWGVPSATGVFNVKLTVADAAGVSATQTFALNVSHLVHPEALPSPTINVAYSQAIRVIGGVPPYTGTRFAGELPAGLTFDPITLALSGTPIENGFFNPVFDFTDANHQTYRSTENISINGGGVNVNIYSDANLGNVQVGSDYSNQLFACCAASSTWSLVAGTLPPGITLSSDGRLSGTAVATGTHTFVIKASDAFNSDNYAQRQFTLHVVSGPVLTVTTGFSLPIGNVGVPYSETLEATGGSGTDTWTLKPFTYLPPGLTLASNGTLSGTPTGSGQYNFTVSVADTDGEVAVASFNLSIYPAGEGPPLAQLQGPSFGTYGIGPIEVSFSATGGTGVYTWAIAAGALPPGLAIRTDHPPYFSTNASAWLAGVATTPGSYTFTVRVTSGSAVADQVCTLRVTGLTVKDGNQFNYLPEAFVGDFYSYQLTALNAAAPVTWTATSDLPLGMTLSVGGVLEGTPTTAGFAFMNVSVTDGVDTVFRGITLLINTLNITTAGVLPNATPGAEYSATLTATGGTPPYTFSGCCPPLGLTLSSAGTIDGTVSEFLAPGPVFLFLRVTDSNHVTYDKIMLIEVISVPATLPSIDLSSYRFPDDCTIGVTCSRGIAVRTGGIAPFAWTATGLPPGLSIRTGTGQQTWISAGSSWAFSLLAGDAELWGVPTAIGVFNVELTVTDSAGAQATQIFPLKVSELLDPVALPIATFNVAYSQAIRVIGGTPPYTGVRSSGRLPAGLALDPNALLLSGTPLENGFFSPVFVFTDANNHSYRVTENLLVVGAGSDITISSNGDLGTIAVGSSYSMPLFACCAPSYAWSIVDGMLPPGLTLSSDGLLAGTAIAAGSYTFLVRASDAANSADYGQRQFTIHVVNGPVLVVTTGFNLPFGNVGSPYSTMLDASGGTGGFTWALEPFNYLPPGLTLASNGTLSGTPTASGQYNFAVTVADTDGQVATGWFIVSIYPVTEAARIEITSPVEPLYELGRVVLAQYSCVNAVSCIGDVPNGAALETSTPGYHTFTVTALDAAGNTTTASATYAVSLGNCVPPFVGVTAWLAGDGMAEELITRTFATWTGTEAYASGRVGQGFAVSPGNSVSLPVQQAGSFTLQAWVATPSAMQPDGTGIISTGTADQLPTTLQLELDGFGNYRLVAGDSALSVLIGPATSTFQHLALTFDGTLVTTYLNGRIVESDQWMGSPGLGIQLLTLGLARNGEQPFTGTIDEVQVFNRALTDGEVQQTFLAGAAGLCNNHAPIVIAVATPNPAEATGPAGALVTLDGTGSSDLDHDPLTYEWVEGTTVLGATGMLQVVLGLGPHTVTLTVADDRGRSATTPITVVVRDTTPPALAIPTAVTAEATSPLGTSVSYSASATDIVSGSVPIDCLPPSGGGFAIGVTIVNCRAVDAAGNVANQTFDVIVRDTTAPVAQIISPSTDAMLSGPTADISLRASDVVGIVSLTVNGVVAILTSGTPQAGTWRATVAISPSPVVPGGALRFDAVATDAGGNPATASLIVDNDAIPSTLDRDRINGADRSSVYSSDFNNGITAGTLNRNGWTAVLANVGTAGTVRAQISGAGSAARIGACLGATKEVRLDVVGETADLTCNPATGTITVRAVSARPWIEVWKQQSARTWLVAQLPAGAVYSTGSPATASRDNVQPIDVRVVHLDRDGGSTIVGGFRLAPGHSVDVSVTPSGANGDEQVHFNVLRGQVAVTMRGRTRTLSNGHRATLPID